jgi:3'-phosphoadenosine 5'-phosphosulfate sulfotransferase (PAPS reductase)/FAD synthetase
VRILNVMGLRAQESPGRRLLAPFSHDDRASNSRRHVDEWLPVHGWNVTQVWDRIEQAATRPHWVYLLGMPRTLLPLLRAGQPGGPHPRRPY